MTAGFVLTSSFCAFLDFLINHKDIQGTRIESYEFTSVQTWLIISIQLCPYLIFLPFPLVKYSFQSHSWPFIKCEIIRLIMLQFLQTCNTSCFKIQAAFTPTGDVKVAKFGFHSIHSALTLDFKASPAVDRLKEKHICCSRALLHFLIFCSFHAQCLGAVAHKLTVVQLL